MLVIVSAPVPVFVSVTSFAADVVPTATLPNASVVALSDTFGEIAGIPLPVNATVSGVADALLTTESVALRAPTLAGVNVTVMLQLAAAAIDAGHVFVIL